MEGEIATVEKIMIYLHFSCDHNSKLVTLATVVVPVLKGRAQFALWSSDTALYLDVATHLVILLLSRPVREPTPSHLLVIKPPPV